jgi:hypothetical protein
MRCILFSNSSNGLPIAVKKQTDSVKALVTENVYPSHS